MPLKSRPDGQGIYIAYGANLPRGQLSALQAFLQVVKQLRGQGVIVQALSSLWLSRAWPDPSDPPYRNAVIKVATDKSPQDLLAYLHATEAEAGRVRTASDQICVNAPRTLDLDLLAYENEILSEGGLILPHPRAHERGFVMGPLAEIAPGWVHPVLGRTSAELYASVTVGRDAHPVERITV